MPESTKKVQTNDDDQMQLYPTVVGIGKIEINPDVIARIAGMAAVEMEGVSLVGGKFGSNLINSIADMIPGKEAVKGIQVVHDKDTGHSHIVVEVKMAYRTPMWDTAEKLQRHIKDTVERMTNLELERVDIKIVDIFVDKHREKGQIEAEE